MLLGLPCADTQHKVCRHQCATERTLASDNNLSRRKYSKSVAEIEQEKNAKKKTQKNYVMQNVYLLTSHVHKINALYIVQYTYM